MATTAGPFGVRCWRKEASKFLKFEYLYSKCKDVTEGRKLSISFDNVISKESNCDRDRDLLT